MLQLKNRRSGSKTGCIVYAFCWKKKKEMESKMENSTHSFRETDGLREKLKIKLWWVGAHERKMRHFLCRLFCPKEIFLDICVLSQCIVYWIHFACSSWISSADELFLERNAAATICWWAVRHVTALIAFHCFTSVFITMRKQQRCGKLKAFNVIFQHLEVLHSQLMFSY